jgi:hypothetical protein
LSLRLATALVKARIEQALAVDLRATTIEPGTTRCSTRASLKPISFIQETARSPSAQS